MNRNISIDIWGNNYDVRFPLTFEFIEINVMRARLTDSHYESLKFLEADGIVASIIVDTVSHFSTLIPKLKEDLNVKGLMQLPMDKIIELCWIYNETYKPFHEEIMKAITLKKEDKPDEKIAA